MYAGQNPRHKTLKFARFVNRFHVHFTLHRLHFGFIIIIISSCSFYIFYVFTFHLTKNVQIHSFYFLNISKIIQAVTNKKNLSIKTGWNLKVNFQFLYKNGTVSINKVFCENLFFNLPNVIKRCPVSKRKEASSRQKSIKFFLLVLSMLL